jgi:DNA mismatch repair protein MutS2
MAAGERTLLISGPNTGGKTVLLKSVALISALAQSGIPVPVGTGSRIPVFDDFFADVGDEQSIQASLSTFSAHLRNISTVLQQADADSLVLMDEIGSGTDPVEGAALAAAVLEELTARQSTTFATTHLGALQQLAARNPAIVNASLQFDSARLAPTYHFIKGVPGRSYGLSIARRLGLPAGIVQRAEDGIPEGERNLAALISSLEARERELSEREIRLAGDQRDVVERARSLADREVRLRKREVEFERESRRAARKHLLDSRAVVERTIRELRAGAAQEEEAARSARRRIEEVAEEHDARLRDLERAESQDVRTPSPAAALAAGDTVMVESLGGRRARVLEIRGNDVMLAVGGMKATVPLSSVSGKVSPPAAAEMVPLRGDLPEEHVSGEIDLRGMRVDEVDQVLIPALDAAARAGLPVFRIIHGKGTGALRGRVQEILSRDNRVKSFRDGAWNEGGTGATMVELA